ncbi:MAG: cob(I)yrinic acid a,c-diamide adenosyltransferase [Candidatus Gracilibacteria bacterium]|jgi:cob(I)alamin adenosyltransferase
MKHRIIAILTGDGKGKTTSAIGTIIRALGHGHRVLLLQFMKETESGEINFLKTLKNSHLKIVQSGSGFFKIKGDHSSESSHKKAAELGIKLLEKELVAFSPTLTILDEINTACSLKLIDPRTITKIIKVNSKTHFILTGRNAPKEFKLIANLITEMKEIRHPFKEGIKAQEGIEF